MADTTTPPTHHTRNAILSAITTVVVAVISAFGAIKVANINRQAEYQKASIGYSKVAEHVTQLDTRVDAIAKTVDTSAGSLKEMNELLQKFLESNTGIKHKDEPPPPVRTYAEYDDPSRPYRRFPIAHRIIVPPPKQAAKDALKGLQKLETKTPVAPKPLPILTPLPSKLDAVKP